jgi:hypothetical protein
VRGNGRGERPGNALGNAAASGACALVHEGDLVLENEAGVAAAADVREVTGDVIVRGSEPYAIGPDDMPCLRVVRGALTIGSVEVPRFTSITFAELEWVEGGVSVGFVESGSADAVALALPRLSRIGSDARRADLVIGEGRLFDTVSLPALEDVSGDVRIGWLEARRIELGSLHTVGGELSLDTISALEAIELGSLTNVGEGFTAQSLPKIPYSSLAEVALAIAPPVQISNVGCNRADGDASPDCAAP